MSDKEIDFYEQLILSGMYNLGDINAGLAHEINNPLAIVLGQVSVIKMMVEKDKLPKEKLLEKLNKVEAATQRVIDLVDKMRMIPRSVTNKENVPVDVFKILQTNQFLVAYPCKKADINLTIDEVNVEEHFIQCVWEEVVVGLDNILKFAVRQIKEQTEESNKWIKLKVSFKNDQFDLQVQYVANIDSNPNLEVAKKLIERYNGKLNWSNEGFQVQFPLSKVANKAA
jgi:phosphoglycerate-specific signal transduction histidine kinase